MTCFEPPAAPTPGSAHARRFTRLAVVRASLTTWGVALAVALAAGACQKPAASGAAGKTPAVTPSPLPAYDENAALHRLVSGQRAFDWAREIVAFGPRPSGSEPLEKTRQFFEQELKKQGWVTERQTFEDTTPRGRLTFVNLRARFAAADHNPWHRSTPLLIASHYDTKHFTDIVFVGANDGASGNALQLELARVLASQPALAQRIELVFFDGEEATIQYTPLDGLHGSRHYARAWREWPRDHRPQRGIVLDMVGEKDLRIEMPANQSSAVLRRLALQAAADAGHQAVFGLSSKEIIDDHVPLAMAGIDMVNFIDMDYRVWHTADDTLEQISAESLATVGRVTLLLLEKYLLR